MSRSSRQTRTLRLSNVRIVCLLRLEISVARAQIETWNRCCAQFGLEALGFGCPEIQGPELPVESDHVRQIVVKIGRADRYAPVPQPLLNSGVVSEIFFRAQAEIHAKDFVLTARRTETGRDARVQRRVGLVDLVTARAPISPDVAKLVE